MEFKQLLNNAERTFNKMSYKRVKNLVSKAVLKESYKLNNNQGIYKFIQANFKGEIVNFYIQTTQAEEDAKTTELWSFYLTNRV